MRLTGKVALVTGAGRPRGIGEAIALQLAKDGADVVVTDYCRERPDLPREKFGQWADLEAVRERAASFGGRTLAVGADVTNEDDVASLVAKVVAEFGRIDILCNNAGGGTGAGPANSTPVVECSRSDWDYTIALSLSSVFLMSKHAGQAMIAGGQGGAIVNTCSVAAHHGVPGCSAYVAAKIGVIGLTRCLALELAPYGIRVNGFSPGVTATQYVQQRVDFVAEHQQRGRTGSDVLRDWVKTVPLGRAAEPAEMAAVAAFLASPDSSYMTGQILGVDGGLTAR